MRRRIPWIAAAVLLLTVILSGCGSKDAASVVKDLDKVMNKMESYEGSGTMTLHTGQQPLNYKVEVWYQKPNFYRIALTNEKRDITQIVLRNNDGVFVLTPSLNKSYRFQSDWPENQGQVYLYQTLIHSITVDNSRQFTTDKDAYVFDVMAGNYQNGSFARQKIWLAKNDYAPKQVQVTDPNNNLMVQVKWDKFNFGKKFDSSAFDMDRNMEQKRDSQATEGDMTDAVQDDAAAVDGKDDTAAVDGKDGTAADPSDDPASAEPDASPSASPADDAAASPEGTTSLMVSEPDPDALPEGVSYLDSTEVMLGDSKGEMIRYTGTYDFTILEKVSKDREVSTVESTSRDLGFTVGFLSGEDVRTLTWSYDGVEYRLTTADLPEDYMMKIAQSMVESSGK